MKIKRELLVTLICDHIEKMTTNALNNGAKLKENQLCMDQDVFKFVIDKDMQEVIDTEFRTRSISSMFGQVSGKPN